MVALEHEKVSFHAVSFILGDEVAVLINDDACLFEGDFCRLPHVAGCFNHSLGEKHLCLILEFEGILFVGHIQQRIELLVRLVYIPGFEARIHNLVFESYSKILALVPILFHEDHCLFDVLLVCFHKVLQPELFGQV